MKWDEDRLYREVRQAEKNTRHHVNGLKQRIRDYHGQHYMGGTESGYRTNPENHAYEYVTLMMRMVHSVPRVAVSSQRGAAQADVAEVMRLALNRWMDGTDFGGVNERLFVDLLMSHAGALVTQVPNDRLAALHGSTHAIRAGFEKADGGSGTVQADDQPQEESKPYWPSVVRLDPWMWGWDPGASTFEEARFVFWKIRRDRSALLEEAKAHPDRGWNRTLLESAAAVSHSGGMGGSSPYTAEVPERDDVLLYEVWVPEVDQDGYSPEDGYHGTIYTLLGQEDGGEQATATFAREPRPYYGPSSGPVCLGGVYTVPGNPWPLSPLAAVEQQVRDLNDLEKSIIAAAKSYKRAVGVPAEEGADVQKLLNAFHDDVLALGGLDPGKLHMFELGGVTQQQIAQAEYQRDRVDRVSGMSDARRGQVTGAATARENDIALAAGSDREAFLAKKRDEFQVDVLMKVAWYLYHDDRVVFPLADGANAEFGVPSGLPLWYEGGDHDVDEGYTFDDLSLQIEPYSQERRNEIQRRNEVVELVGMTGQLLPLAQQSAQWADWAKVFDLLGETYNVPEWGKNFDFAAAGAMVPPEVQGQTAGTVSRPAPPGSRGPVSNYSGAPRGGGPRGLMKGGVGA